MKHWRLMNERKHFAGRKCASAVTGFLALAVLLCATSANLQAGAQAGAQAGSQVNAHGAPWAAAQTGALANVQAGSPEHAQSGPHAKTQAGPQANAQSATQPRGQVGPQAPCGGTEPVPAYASLNDPPNVKAWSKTDLGRDWKPPACTGWTAVGFTALVTTAARFRYPEDADALLHHIGAISQLKGMRYWSNTHKRWQTLVMDAYALTGVQHSGREDFTADELKAGKELYFEQVDNLSGKATYRMHIDEASRDRIVFDIENVSAIHYFLVRIFRPGELQSIYFLDRESEHIWRYYSMLRMGKNANGMAAGNESSAINRAVAFYRWLAGIPTDQEPPAAR